MHHVKHPDKHGLIDVATSAQLADEVGKEPRFSPTGRFVISFDKSQYAILDTADGKFVQRTDQERADDSDIAWDNHDSFVVVGTGWHEYGQIGIISPLIEDGKGVWTGGECGVTLQHALGEESFKIDLANNIAAADCGPDIPYVYSLTIALGEGESPDNGPNFLRTMFVVPFTTPQNWEMIDGLKLSHVEAREHDPERESFLMRPIAFAPGSKAKVYGSTDPLRIASRSIGQLNLSEAARITKAEKSIKNFGVEVNPGVRAVDIASSKLPKARNSVPKDAKSLEDCEVGTKTEEMLAPKDATLFTKIEEEGFRLTIMTRSCVAGSGRVLFPNAFLDDSRRPKQLLDLRAEFVQLGGGGDCVVGSFFACGFEGQFFFNRYLVLWSQKSQAAAVYDVDRRALIAELLELPSPDAMQRMSLSRDLKTLTKLDKDGGFQVIALKPAERDKDGHVTEASTKVNVLLSGRIVDDEVVAWTPSGQFDSTAEGASHVAVRFPGRSGEYTLDQFHKLFHVNDLVKRALAGEAFKLPMVKTFPPSINVKPTFMADSVAAKIEILGDDPVDEIRVYQDGLMTNVIPVAGNAKAVDVSAKRLPGARWVAFLARGPSGLFAQPSTYDAGLFPGARRRVHIVSVGIDRYDDDRIQQLHFAGSDAARFLKTLQDKAGTSVEIVSQTLLRDADASREAILAKLNETIAKAEPGDSILLFIAGHGVQAADKNYRNGTLLDLTKARIEVW